MWWKAFVILHLIVLRKIISSQPIIDSTNAPQQRQTNLDECCPCPTYRDGSNNFGELDLLPTSRISSFARTPLDECPSRFAGADSEGASSIFHPSVLRAALPSERKEDLKQEPKPLLEPEVGLASSVLETLREATDEEYKEALARDAVRSALYAAESELLDADPVKTRNSVTIVFNPKEDLSSDDDAIPEASHTQETRCIHSPLGSSQFMGRQSMKSAPVLKEYILLPKRKPVEILHTSMADMDDSPSNIYERTDVSVRNGLNNKLKINPLLLNQFETGRNDQLQTAEILNNCENFGTKARTMSADNSNNFKSDGDYIVSPLSRLASLKSRIRDFSEKLNAKRLNNVDIGFKHSQLNKVNTENVDQVSTDLNTEVSPFNIHNPAIGKSTSFIVKNNSKLKDVELITPRKNTLQVIKDDMNYTDLNIAGTENSNDVNVISNNNKNEIINTEKCRMTLSTGDSGEDFQNNLKESNVITKKGEQVLNSTIQSIGVEDPNISETSPVSDMQVVCDEQEIERNTDKSIRGVSSNNRSNKASKENIEYSLGDINEINDSIPETSNNIMHKVSDEDVSMRSQVSDSNDIDRNRDGCFEDNLEIVKEPKGKFSLRNGNNNLTSFRNDLLRRLENLKQTIRPNLLNPEITLVTPKPDTNSNKNVQVNTNLQTKGESDVSLQDLQILSDSLLNQENPRKGQEVSSQDTECNMPTYDSYSENAAAPNNILNDSKSGDTTVDYEAMRLDENELLPKNLSNFDDDPVYAISNSGSQEEIENFKNFDANIYDEVPGDIFRKDTTTMSTPDQSNTTLTGHTVAKNEMSSQASDSKYNAITPHMNNLNLRSSLPDSIIVQPSLPADELNLFEKPFQIPSLEEIRQGITNILDSGLREEVDPINESSNRNSVLSPNTKFNSKLPKLSRLKDIDIDLYQLKPLEKLPNLPSIAIPRLNINSFKTKLALPESEILKPLKLESILGNRDGIIGASLSLGSDKLKFKGNTKSALDKIENSFTDLPTLDDISTLVKSKSQNILKLPTIPIQRSNLFEWPASTDQTLSVLRNDLKNHADDAIKAIRTNTNEGKPNYMGSLSNIRADSNDFLEAIARKREDMKEKLQALHVDFNDRLASIHERLADQASLQSINIPIYKESGNLGFPKIIGSDKGGDIKHLFSTRDRNTLSKPNSLGDKIFMNKQSEPFTSVGTKHNDKLVLKNNIKAFPEPPLMKTANRDGANKFDEFKSNIGRQKGVTPFKNSKVKISFSTTTTKTIIEPKLQKKPVLEHVKKFSLEKLKNQNNDHINMKPKGTSLKYRLKNLGDLNRSPSELMSARIPAAAKSVYDTKNMKNPEGNLNNKLKNTVNNVENQLTEINSDSQTKIIQKPALTNIIPVSSPHQKSLPDLILPKSKQTNSFLANIRETIRARLSSMTPTEKTLGGIQDASTIDAIHSPSDNVETISNNLMKENMQYKCSMMCVKD